MKKISIIFGAIKQALPTIKSIIAAIEHFEGKLSAEIAKKATSIDERHAE